MNSNDPFVTLPPIEILFVSIFVFKRREAALLWFLKPNITKLEKRGDVAALIEAVGYPLDSASPYMLWSPINRLEHRIIGFRRRVDGLLHEPKKELPAALGFPSVEAKSEFVQIVG